MKNDLDQQLNEAFSAEKIIETFFLYKLAKWDRFSSPEFPKITIPTGADGVHFKAFEKQIIRNSKNIETRVMSGSYFFYPIREVEIPKNMELGKSPDNTRVLGISSIRDWMVQSILYENVLYKHFESIFSKEISKTVSFAYRKGYSAPKMALEISKVIKDDYCFVYDADITKFFDCIDHDILFKKIENYLNKDTKCFRLIKRFIKTDRIKKSTYKNPSVFHNKNPIRKTPKPTQGIPQGGILSGLLANLFLHDFDKWIVDVLMKEFDIKYFRYADDFIIFSKSKTIIDEIAVMITDKLLNQFKLRINESKTKIVDLNKNLLEFVGFEFKEKLISVRKKNITKFNLRIKNSVKQCANEMTNFDQKSINNLLYKLNFKIRGHFRYYTCPKCNCEKLGSPRSWMAFFSVINDYPQLKQLDKGIRKEIYSAIHLRFKHKISREDLKNLFSIVKEKSRIANMTKTYCLCDLENEDDFAKKCQMLWSVLIKISRGKILNTLIKNIEFSVTHTDQNYINVRRNNKNYKIMKQSFIKVIEIILKNKKIKRSEIEELNIKCSSYIVPILLLLEIFISRLNPIEVVMKKQKKSSFLELNSISMA